MTTQMYASLITTRLKQPAQVLTYLKLTSLRLGLLINFNVEVLRSGIYRIIALKQGFIPAVLYHRGAVSIPAVLISREFIKAASQSKKSFQC